jgi:EmrB/QacA subfamily drug resistance transporter
VISPEHRNTALLVASCFFMENLDGTIVTTATPRIGASLHVTSAETGLVITAYLVTLAVLIPLSGWLTSRWGARPVFLAAIATFTLASLGCAVSSSLGELVAMRVLQGAGGAMMVPVGRLVVLSSTDKSDLMTVMSYIVWPGLIAPVIAPLAGGLITTYASWRWLFLINVPLGALALWFANRLIKSMPAEAVSPLDRAGVLLTCGGLAGLTYTAHLLSASKPAWTTIAAVGAASAVLLGAAVRHLLRAEAPLVNLRALQARTFRAAIGGAGLFWITVGAAPFLLALLFQNQFGWSPVKSGAVILVLFLGNVGIKPITTFLLNRFGFRSVLVASAGSLAASVIVMALLTASTPLFVIAAVVLVSGAARSVGLTSYNAMAFSEIPPEQLRDANTLSATNQQLFAGLAIAVATLGLRAGASLHGVLPGRRGPYEVAFGALGVVSLLAMVGALRLHPTAGEAVRRPITRRRARAIDQNRQPNNL